ncbi:MAG: DUF3253 domain-containing protein [Pseudomonadota bacterium]
MMENPDHTLVPKGLEPCEAPNFAGTIREMVTERGSGRSICPSEVARALAGKDEKAWRLLMKPIRAAAVALAKDGEIAITRKGRPVDPDDFKGVYRLTVVPDQD